jgi:imidazolonepropionase-like amidohydrolase
MFRLRSLACLVALAALETVCSPLAAQPPEVLRPTVFAIREARVFCEPGKVLPRATIVIRDGLIAAVGPAVKVPPDALIIDDKKLTVYPGFIDAMSTWGFDPALRRSETGPAAPVDFASEALAATRADNRKGLTPEFVVSTALRMEPDPAEAWRRQGFTTHLVAPDGGFIVGQSALVSLSGAPPREAVLRSPVAMHAALHSMGGSGDYPRSLMGVFAHVRQTLLDAGHYQRVRAAFEKDGSSGHRPPFDPALAALGPVLEQKLPVVFEADSRDEIHRALDFAAEFRLRPIIYGGREAWKAADRLKKEQVPVLLRLNFVEQPQARMGRRVSGPFYESSAGQEGDGAVPKRVLAEHERQLKEEIHNAAALAQKGVRFAFSGQGLEKPEKFRENLRKVLAEGLSPDAALAALTMDAARLLGIDKQLGTIASGKPAHLVVTDGDFQEAKTQVCYVFADGVRFDYAKPATPPKAMAPMPADKAQTKAPKTAEPAKGAAKPAAKPSPASSPAKKPAATQGEQATEIEADRKPRLHPGGNLLIRGATLLTVTHGTLPKTDLLIRDGKIAQVGANLPVPNGVAVLEAAGMFVMPGIIDTHCHFAISGGVNEFSLSVVPEARVRDVIASDDVQIYRALAGGVTTARLLHGSANVIGGQDAVIKLKYGEPASKLLVGSAPRGVKFALGENVKRTDGRFPNTRLGVEAVLVRAFTEALAYRKTWDDYDKARAQGSPVEEPRRDLRLEALADVVQSRLRVHCHCYRADEILMLLRVANHFGFKIKSLQHVLEGYKIAAEIADHGASCSTFSDWWAYKIEAYDAIPFNSALLHEAGASVCLKSDSNELMRHLYQEAAKCIKYGGMGETAALETITLNGAKQLGLEGRTGSIEVGKDADLAIFNGHPLNSYARVEMTLVDGEVYFQRSDRLVAIPPASASPTPPAGNFQVLPRSSGKTYAIAGATVHSVSGPPQKAMVLVANGKIGRIEKLVEGKALQEQVAALTKTVQATVIDATGLHLYPGMIDAGTVIGLTELGSLRETHDFAEGGDFQPDLHASAGINPDSELIPVTRANGVTTVVTRPVGSIIAGQSALIDLAGWVPQEMAVVDPLALHVEFPAVAPMFTGDPTMPMVGRAIARKQREEKVRRLKELFQQARNYSDARTQDASRPINPRLEALVPYARGQKPVVIQAHRKQELQEVLKLADDLHIKVILSGAIDAWKVASELKKRNIPVILGPVMTMPQEVYDPYDAPYACAARLHAAGVRFCIRSAGTSNTRNLPYEAAMAVSYGLPPEEGLKAVTLYPAQILGVADQLGSIDAGKRANLVLSNGDLLQASSQVLALFIDGRPLEPTSKQTRLYERYRERLREVREGRSPLGTK